MALMGLASISSTAAPPSAPVRYHVPLTDQSHALCGDEATRAARTIIVGVNTTLTGFTTRDFSPAVTGDVMGLVNQVQALAAGGGVCAGYPGVRPGDHAAGAVHPDPPARGASGARAGAGG